MKQRTPCLFESDEHRKIPVKVLGENTIEMLQYFFHSTMEAVDRIQMVYLVIVSVVIQNYLHTVLLFRQLIVSSSPIALKDTVLRNTITDCIFNILSTRFCSIYAPGNNVIIPVCSNATAHLLALERPCFVAVSPCFLGFLPVTWIPFCVSRT